MARENTKAIIRITVNVGDAQVDGAFEVPTAPVPKRYVLPILRSFSGAIEQLAPSAQASCRKGCDACCRQMVPISPTEVHELAAAFSTVAPGLAQRISGRFERAVEQLEQRGLLERLRRRHELSPADLAQLDRDYFAAQIPCPFLERHACAIHAIRPLACREFLVTSDPRHCSDPGSGRVARVELPARASVALTESDGEGWVPLILAREYAAKNAEREVNAKSAVEDVLKRL
jgi:Fe-S-cluster containining protein